MKLNKEYKNSLNNQQKVYQYILKNPGTHLRKISRDLSINLSTLRYHINYLENKGVLISSKEANLKVFYVSGEVNTRDKKIASILQQKRFREIILLLLINPGISHKEISIKLLLNPSTLSKYLKILLNREILILKVQNKRNQYYISDEKRVLRILLTYKRTFWDDKVDKVLKMYFE